MRLQEHLKDGWWERGSTRAPLELHGCKQRMPGCCYSAVQGSSSCWFHPIPLSPQTFFALLWLVGEQVTESEPSVVIQAGDNREAV